MRKDFGPRAWTLVLNWNGKDDSLAGIYFAFPPVAAVNAFISVLLIETCITIAFYILQLRIYKHPRGMLKTEAAV